MGYDAREGLVRLDPDMPMIRQGQAVQDAMDERQRAHAKHVNTHAGSREQKPWDDPLWLSIIMEEVGEIARALNDREPLGRLRAEVIQAAAMCLAYADALEEAMGAEVRVLDCNAVGCMADDAEHCLRIACNAGPGQQ